MNSATSRWLQDETPGFSSGLWNVSVRQKKGGIYLTSPIALSVPIDSEDKPNRRVMDGIITEFD
ncbi:hypothetical protein RvY_11039 [Ramazzottius varieornatus]|uniref:Uncharacterized protein n=1 Tax=Ramazzottius varieornatus TaxID=947166 RepID=A0A1D1VGV0_RAMVA|nr:hypothetical protein RvY_11039 [Ramazzottius varieornatus]